MLEAEVSQLLEKSNLVEVENDIASDFKVLANQGKLYISLKTKRFGVAGFVVVLLEAECAKNLLVYYFEHTVLLHALLAFLNVVLQASYFMTFKEMRFFCYPYRICFPESVENLYVVFCLD